MDLDLYYWFAHVEHDCTMAWLNLKNWRLVAAIEELNRLRELSK